MKRKETESIFSVVERIIDQARKNDFPSSFKVVAPLLKREPVETMHLLNHELKNRIGYQISSAKNILVTGDLTTIFLTKT